MKINKYPDGSSYVSINYKQDCPLKTFKINTYEDLWHLNQFVDACNNNNIIPTITIPNLIDAQADRRFNSNESSGLKLVCKFLNSMNANFRIFHPHNPEVVEALMSNVEILNNSEFIRKCLIEINRYHYSWTDESTLYLNSLKDNLILMSSDAGGFKPLMKLCDKINWKGEVYSASKSRLLDDDNNSVLYQQVDKEDFEGKDILIVDDICVYGGTFKGLSKLLKLRNCGKLYLAVSHMTVENLGEDPVTDYFDRVFTTNSKYDKYYCNEGEDGFIGKTKARNLEIIKMFNYENIRNNRIF
jgi:ribose-phosphate pyrophosphokinase